VFLQARNYPEVGDQVVNYPDLNIDFKVIPLNTLARRSIVNGLEDDLEQD